MRTVFSASKNLKSRYNHATGEYGKVALYKLPEPNYEGLSPNYLVAMLPSSNRTCGYYWGVPAGVSESDTFMRMQLNLAQSILKHIFAGFEYPKEFVQILSNEVLSKLPSKFLISEETLIITLLEEGMLQWKTNRQFS